MENVTRSSSGVSNQPAGLLMCLADSGLVVVGLVDDHDYWSRMARIVSYCAGHFSSGDWLHLVVQQGVMEMLCLWIVGRTTVVSVFVL